MPVSEVKAIETEYNGYRFRSRLEARWAVFFDTVGIKYEYEPEGYKTEDGVMYLPDFYSPDLDVYFEVKPDREGAIKELEKAASVIKWGSPVKCIVVLSQIPNGYDGGLWHFPCFYWHGMSVETGWYYFAEYGDGVIGKLSSAPYIPPFKQDCFVQAVSDERLKIIPYRYFKPDKDDIDFMACTKYLNMELNKRVYDGLSAARKARFEHGEHGTYQTGNQKNRKQKISPPDNMTQEQKNDLDRRAKEQGLQDEIQEMVETLRNVKNSEGQAGILQQILAKTEQLNNLRTCNSVV